MRGKCKERLKSKKREGKEKGKRVIEDGIKVLVLLPF